MLARSIPLIAPFSIFATAEAGASKSSRRKTPKLSKKHRYE